MTSQTVDPQALADPAVQRLLGRSALYELLALSVAYPEPGLLDRIDALLHDLEGREIVRALGVERQLRALRIARDDVDAERLAPVCFTLFEGSVLCSPHETEYVRDPFAKAARLADIAGFYAAFGLQVSTVNRGTPDNIGAELEFMALVTRREAYAVLQQWTEQAETCRSAMRTFMDEHLGRWVQAFSSDLCQQADEASASRGDPAAGIWFHAVAELLRATIDAEIAAMGVYPSLLHTRITNDELDGAFVCPMVSAQPAADQEGGGPGGLTT